MWLVLLGLYLLSFFFCPNIIFAFFFFYSLLNPLSLFTTYTMYVGGFQQYFPRSRLLSGKSTKVSGPARPGLVKKKGLFDRRSLAICIDNQPQTTTQCFVLVGVVLWALFGFLVFSQGGETTGGSVLAVATVIQ